MSAFWYIEDHSETTIYITDLWREFFIPKFRINRISDEVPYEEPYVYLTWNDREGGTGGESRELIIDYRDIVDGYSGYLSDISSAQQLADNINEMIVSGFVAAQGEILQSKGDLLTHDGVSDTILPGGSNGFILQRDDAELTGLKWIDPSSVAVSSGFHPFLLMGG